MTAIADMSTSKQRQLPKVQNRKEFIDCLENMISQPPYMGKESYRGRPRELKTYIVESDGGFPRHLTCGKISGEVNDTGLDNIKILRMSYAKNILEFFLDVSDKRFLTLHTNERSEDTNKVIEALIEDHNYAFDNTWFYSSMLKRFSQKRGNVFRGFGISYTGNTFAQEPNSDSDIEDLSLSINGSLATEVQNLVEGSSVGRAIAYNTVRILRGEPPDSVQDDVHNNGYFAVKRGKSIQDHLRLVDSCKEEYADVVHSIENSCVGVKDVGGKALVDGDSFDFEFKNKIEDVEFFITKMFNSAKPFRLWGLKSKIDDDYYKVTAVDLHAGGTIHFDIAKDMMRVVLYEGACGNTILRLFTNLQIHFDSKITCRQLSS